MTYMSMTSWLARAALIPLALLAASAAQVVWWTFDRTAPFGVLQVDPATVLPGGTLVLSANVHRDTARKCDATMSRWILDARGYRHDIGGTTSFPSASIDLLEQRMPGKLMVRIETPTALPEGRSELVTTLTYVCNPVHRVYPIVVVTSMPFNVLAPATGHPL